MPDVTQILSLIEQGNAAASEDLLPLVYEELRRLAALRMADEKPGQTLQSTALVHEAYVRLVDVEKAQKWDSRGHFFAAAAEAMRRILVERARKRKRLKRGGNLHRTELQDRDLAIDAGADEILAVEDALEKLEQEDELAAKVLQCRYFAGLSIEDAAKSLQISRATAYRHWTYARAWVRAEMLENPGESNSEKKSQVE